MGLPLSGLEDISNIPHTISYALLHRLKINSFNELPKDKRPPRNLWDKPSRLDEFFDEMFSSGSNKPKGTKSYDVNIEDVE